MTVVREPCETPDSISMLCAVWSGNARGVQARFAVMPGDWAAVLRGALADLAWGCERAGRALRGQPPSGTTYRMLRAGWGEEID